MVGLRNQMVPRGGLGTIDRKPNEIKHLRDTSAGSLYHRFVSPSSCLWATAPRRASRHCSSKRCSAASAQPAANRMYRPTLPTSVAQRLPEPLSEAGTNQGTGDGGPHGADVGVQAPVASVVRAGSLKIGRDEGAPHQGAEHPERRPASASTASVATIQSDAWSVANAMRSPTQKAACSWWRSRKPSPNRTSGASLLRSSSPWQIRVEAREKALAYRKQARDGGDPIAERQKLQAVLPTFAEAAEKVYAEHRNSWKNA